MHVAFAPKCRSVAGTRLQASTASEAPRAGELGQLLAVVVGRREGRFELGAECVSREGDQASPTTSWTSIDRSVGPPGGGLDVSNRSLRASPQRATSAVPEVADSDHGPEVSPRHGRARTWPRLRR
jgi:hypothetical protein